MGCKQKAIYVKCCVIQCGVADYHDDVLSATDIKKIFTTFNNQNNFEIYHNEIPISDVSLMENYISTNDEVIAGTVVPKGSWNAVIRVDNPQIKEMLLNNDFGGVSLNNRVQTACSTGLEGAITYSQLRDAECVIPVYISFVESPANMVGLHIMDYNVYIQKSKENEKDMSLLEDLKALIKRAEEDESSADETIEKEATDDSEEEPVEEETEEEVAIVESAEEETEEKEEPVIEKEAKEESEEDEESEDSETDDADVSIEKAEEDETELVEEAEEFDAEAEIKNINEQIQAIWEIIKPLEAEADENPIDQDVTVEDTTDEPIITKSAKIEMTESTSSIDFYERTGRDRITGKRIRKQSKILN